MYQGIKERDTLNDSIVALRDHHTTRIEDDRLYFSSTIALKGGKNICYWELMPSSAGFRRIPADSAGMRTIVPIIRLLYPEAPAIPHACTYQHRPLKSPSYSSTSGSYTVGLYLTLDTTAWTSTAKILCLCRFPVHERASSISRVFCSSRSPRETHL